MRNIVNIYKKHWLVNAVLAVLLCVIRNTVKVIRNTVKKHKKHWFVNAGLAVLACVICIWIVKLATIDVDSTKAVVYKQAKIPATRIQVTPQRISEDKHNMSGPSTDSLVFRHTPSTMPVSALRKERGFLNTTLDLIRTLAEQENLKLIINKQGSYEEAENNGK